MSIFGSLLGGILGIGGGAIAANGAADAANAQSKAAMDALKFKDEKAQLAQLINIAMTYGGDAAMQMAPALLGQEGYNRIFGTQATQGTGLSAQDQARLAEIDAAINNERGGSSPSRMGMGGVSRGGARGGNNPASVNNQRIAELERERDQIRSRATGTAGTPGLMNPNDLKAFGGGIFGDIGALADASKTQGANDLRMLDDRLAGIAARDQNIIDQASQNYQNEMGAYERDAQRMKKSLDQQTIASLTGAGVGGSSILGNQIGANALRTNEMIGDRRRQVEQAKNEYLTGLRTNALNRDLQMGLSRFGFGQDLANRDINMRSGLLSAKLGNATSGTFNPWANADTSQYFRAGGAGTMAQALGGTVGGIGTNVLGNSLAKLLGIEDKNGGK